MEILIYKLVKQNRVITKCVCLAPWKPMVIISAFVLMQPTQGKYYKCFAGSRKGNDD